MVYMQSKKIHMQWFLGCFHLKYFKYTTITHWQVILKYLKYVDSLSVTHKYFGDHMASLKYTCSQKTHVRSSSLFSSQVVQVYCTGKMQIILQYLKYANSL